MSTPVQKLFDLTGQVALVTGGSRGLGLQMAEALGEAGAKVMLTSRKAADLEEAAADLQAKGIDTRWIAADAADPAQIQKVVDETMQRLGRIDILVNNAGATWGAPAEDHPLEAWDKVMNLNIRSLFLYAQAVGKASMLPRAAGASSTSRRSPGWPGRLTCSSSPTAPARARSSTSRARWPASGGRTASRQRAGAGLLPEQDDAGRAPRTASRRWPCGAAAPPGRRRRPEGRRAAVRQRGGQAHHRADPGGGRRRQCRAQRLRP
jgi:NAD(P)-dependent dehydrogenase (short-subunit alcohol dehydrogenase family)